MLRALTLKGKGTAIKLDDGSTNSFKSFNNTDTTFNMKNSNKISIESVSITGKNGSIVAGDNNKFDFNKVALIGDVKLGNENTLKANSLLVENSDIGLDIGEKKQYLFKYCNF